MPSTISTCFFLSEIVFHVVVLSVLAHGLQFVVEAAAKYSGELSSGAAGTLVAEGNTDLWELMVIDEIDSVHSV